MIIKMIEPIDFKETSRVIKAAFTSSTYGYTGEAELVEKIRLEETYDNKLELIAINNQDIIGHGLLSEACIKEGDTEVVGLVLAPLSVHPDFQSQGIGGKLIIELEKHAAKSAYPFISILGDPNYYSKFGYTKASDFQIKAPFDVPEEAFLIKELTTGSLKNVTGILNYSKAFE